MINTKNILLGSLLASLSFASQATVFSFEDLNANNGGIADRLETIHSTYDDSAERFTWDTTFNANPTDVDGFWLVVNNGPNPKKSNVNELAIMYGDMKTNTLTTYVYNGLNSANSYKTTDYLQTDTFSSDSNSLSIDIDVSAINSWSRDPAYSGVSFDEKIGIWFHISTGSTFTGLTDSGFTDYSFASQGWYDKDNLDATTVSEPGSLALLGLGLVGLASYRRRKA